MKKILCVLLAILLITTTLAFVGCAKELKNPTESRALTKYDDVYFYATGAAVSIVKNELKYPYNSTFEDEADMLVVYSVENNQYTVYGEVYAANAFGVKTKKEFTAKFTLSFYGNDDKYSYSNASCSFR